MGKRDSLIDYRDTEEQITFTVKRPSMRYVNEFLNLKCAPDLLAWEVYPNVKEITESFAAFNAVRKVLKDDRLKDNSVIVYCVGDGRTPRTAACFAVRSAWTAVSIDPQLNDAIDWGRKIKRLWTVPLKVEEMEFRPGFNQTRVVVAVHSHADLQHTEKFEPEIVVSIPCCVPQTYGGRPPDHEYTDWGILSPERTVKVWDNRRRMTS